MRNEQKERPAQERKSVVKLYRLMTAMPRGAATAMARLGASMRYPSARVRYTGGMTAKIEVRAAVSMHANATPLRNLTIRKGRNGRKTIKAR